MREGRQKRSQIHRRSQPCGPPESKDGNQIAAQRESACAAAHEIDGVEQAEASSIVSAE
jgi:hypothetical protein